MNICTARLPRRATFGLRGLVRVRVGVGLLLVLWLLCALAPAISRTLDHGKPLAQRGWVQVCNAQGLVWVQANGHGSGSDAPDPGGVLQQDSCAYCTLASDRSTPPSSFDGWGLVPLATQRCPGWAGGRGLWAHTPPTPPARGPPASS